jgi:iron complex outermembrane receptor protein
MKTIYLRFLATILLTPSLAQTTIVQDSISEIQLEEVKLAGLRVDQDQPFSFSNVAREELASRNLGQDLPILLNYLPGVVTTSDAGAGIGYTGIRVRGSDATRVNVTINGIPYNDAESQGVYWVNMPDFTASVSSLQLQRGVGTSTNGSGAFGASLNLLTDKVAQKAFAEITQTAGSFNSFKQSLKFSTGLLNNHFELSGRLSKITSDGYLDRASSHLKSYFIQAAFLDENTLIKALAFGGKEITYQSWYGVDQNTLATNRRYNPAGGIYDEMGTLEEYYDNQVDHYQQDHYQWHWSQKIDSYSRFSLGLNYTYGRGYYEEYKDLWYEQNVNYSSENSFAYLGLSPLSIGGTTIDATENTVRKWLDNDYYVATFSLNHQKGNTEWNLGGFYSRYVGDHFGELVFAEYSSGAVPGHRFYQNRGNKIEGNVFAKINHRISPRISGYLDLQYRGIGYTAQGNLKGPTPIDINENYVFFNPKLGGVYTWDVKNKFYFSVAKAQREPSRSDFENGNPKAEQLTDYELGWRFESEKIRLLFNLYLMDYTNQLVLSGALDDVGMPIRENVGKSSRIGIELEGTFSFGSRWSWQPNLTLSRNRNHDFYFQRNGVLKALGETHLSFSPAIVAGNIVAFRPAANWKMALLTKYVGEQYMGNIDAEMSKLKAYTVSDLNINYRLIPKSLFKEINLSLLLNNLLGARYVSNGYFYTFDDDYSVPGAITTYEGAGYYPQAQFHFLAGVTLSF